MKTLILISFVGMLCSCSLISGRSDDQNRARTQIRNVPYVAQKNSTGGLRHRILVLPFLDEKLDRSQKVKDSARRVVVNDLIRSRNFVVINHKDLPTDLGKFVTENNDYDLESLSPNANSMGVAAVVEGKILEVKAQRISDSVGLFRKIRARIFAKVRIRIVSARSSKIIFEEVRNAEVESDTTRVAKYSYSDRFLSEDPHLVRLAVKKAFRGAIRQMALSVEKIAWKGRVALVSGERIFVNAGRLTGIQVGDVLKITEAGNEIYDPESGVFLGRAPGRMKGTIEVVSYFGKDGAVAIVHSGSGFKKNDKVELY